MKPEAKTRALIVSWVRVFPPESGGQLRTAALAAELAAKGHDVSVFSFTGRRAGYLAGTRSEWTAVTDGVREYVSYSRALGFLQWLSFRLGVPPVWLTLVTRWFVPRVLREELRSADSIVIDFPYPYPVALWPRRGPVLLHSHNVEHKCWSGWKARVVRAVEARAALAVDGVLCCGEDDYAFYKERRGSEQGLSRVKNRVDPKRFLPDPALRRRVREELGVREGERLVLFSASRYAPNRAAFESLRRLARDGAGELERLGIRLCVVGSVSAEPLREGRLVATGPVPAVEPYFLASDIAVNPVESGSGTSLKLLEFVAARLPVFSTPFGARGSGLRAGEDYVECTPVTLGDALVKAFECHGAEGRLRAMAESAYSRLVQGGP